MNMKKKFLVAYFSATGTTAGLAKNVAEADDDGLLDDLGVCEGRVGGGAIGAWRWRRCLPEVQDALVSVLSERRLAVPELEIGRAHV